MFSIITMASSTTNPVEIVSAISVRLFRLKSSRYITANVPTSDRGTATLGMTVAANVRRNRKMTSTTRAIVSISSNCTSSTEARIVTVRSVRIDDFDGGRQVAAEVRQAPLDVVDDLDNVGARLPLDVHDDGRRQSGPSRLRDRTVASLASSLGEPIQAACRRFSTSSITVATSESNTGPVGRYAMTSCLILLGGAAADRWPRSCKPASCRRSFPWPG